MASIVRLRRGQIALGQGNVGQPGPRLGGQRPIAELLEGVERVLEGRGRRRPLPHRGAHMAENQRGIDQPEQDIAALLVDLVGLFRIAQAPPAPRRHTGP